jgi:hypothetical protein
MSAFKSPRDSIYSAVRVQERVPTYRKGQIEFVLPIFQGKAVFWRLTQLLSVGTQYTRVADPHYFWMLASDPDPQ